MRTHNDATSIAEAAERLGSRLGGLLRGQERDALDYFWRAARGIERHARKTGHLLEPEELDTLLRHVSIKGGTIGIGPLGARPVAEYSIVGAAVTLPGRGDAVWPTLPESWPAEPVRWRDPSDDALPLDPEMGTCESLEEGGWGQSMPVLVLVQRDHGGGGPARTEMAVARDDWDEDGVTRSWLVAGRDKYPIVGRVLAWAPAPIPAHLGGEQ